MLTITVAGGDLYRVALEQYGDATAWTQIAQANGLADPVVQGVRTLLVPPYAGGGLVVL